MKVNPLCRKWVLLSDFEVLPYVEASLSGVTAKENGRL